MTACDLCSSERGILLPWVVENATRILCMECRAKWPQVCCAGEPHTCDQEAIAVAEGKTDRLIGEVVRLRKLLEETSRIASEALDSAHGIPTIVDVWRDRLAEIREEGEL